MPWDGCLPWPQPMSRKKWPRHDTEPVRLKRMRTLIQTKRCGLSLCHPSKVSKHFSAVAQHKLMPNCRSRKRRRRSESQRSDMKPSSRCPTGCFFSRQRKRVKMAKNVFEAIHLRGDVKSASRLATAQDGKAESH